VSDVHERLRRLLFLVPYVSRNPGISMEALAQALGLSREALLEDLDLLTLVGRPPFQPDDYIDLHVENDRVYVDLDQRLSKPPRLTAAEAAALTAAAELLRPSAEGALSGALKKLEKVLPPGARPRYREMGAKIDAAFSAPAELGPLTQAIATHQEVEFDYFSQGRGQTEHRTVRPRELFSHRGQWYLSGYCLTRGDQRLFRLDRIQGLAVTPRTFTAEPGSPGEVPNPAAERGEVRVRFTPEAAPYVRERFGEHARSVGGGAVEVRVSGESERWLAQWVLSFGGGAEVMEPDWAREAVARAAAASLKS
jgi:proteasome accessory factor C